MGTTTCIKEQCIGPGRGAVGCGGGDGGWRGGEGQSLVLSGVFVSPTDPRLQAVGDGQSLSRRGPSLSGWRHLVVKQTPPHAPPPLLLLRGKDGVEARTRRRADAKF